MKVVRGVATYDDTVRRALPAAAAPADAAKQLSLVMARFENNWRSVNR